MALIQARPYSPTSYLTGVVNVHVIRHARRPDLGLLITPDTADYEKYIATFDKFGADNGCFSSTKVFDEQRWITWLKGLPRDGCLWATAPDVVGDHQATVERSAPWLPIIQEMGFRAAFVVQNGATVANVPWDTFDAVFVGGVLECLPCGWAKPTTPPEGMSPKEWMKVRRCPHCTRRLTEWKTSEAVALLAAEAKRRGMLVHVGRVNSEKRMRFCESVDADSADGTYVMFGPPAQQMADIVGWLDQLALQPRLAA